MPTFKRPCPPQNPEVWNMAGRGADDWRDKGSPTNYTTGTCLHWGPPLGTPKAEGSWKSIPLLALYIVVQFRRYYINVLNQGSTLEASSGPAPAAPGPPHCVRCRGCSRPAAPRAPPPEAMRPSPCSNHPPMGIWGMNHVHTSHLQAPTSAVALRIGHVWTS